VENTGTKSLTFDNCKRAGVTFLRGDVDRHDAGPDVADRQWLWAVLLSICVSGGLFARDDDGTALAFLNVAKCNFSVEGAEVVDSVIEERGMILKRSYKGGQLIEVKLVESAPETGEIGLYPSIFSLVLYWRGVPRIHSSIAIGTKHQMPSGEMDEYWLNLPEASMIIEYEAGEEMIIYTLFEVPKDLKEFKIQNPAIIERDLTLRKP